MSAGRKIDFRSRISPELRREIGRLGTKRDSSPARGRISARNLRLRDLEVMAGRSYFQSDTRAGFALSSRIANARIPTIVTAKQLANGRGSLIDAANEEAGTVPLFLLAAARTLGFSDQSISLGLRLADGVAEFYRNAGTKETGKSPDADIIRADGNSGEQGGPSSLLDITGILKSIQDLGERSKRLEDQVGGLTREKDGLSVRVDELQKDLAGRPSSDDLKKLEHARDTFRQMLDKAKAELQRLKDDLETVKNERDTARTELKGAVPASAFEAAQGQLEELGRKITALTLDLTSSRSELEALKERVGKGLDLIGTAVTGFEGLLASVKMLFGTDAPIRTALEGNLAILQGALSALSGGAVAPATQEALPAPKPEKAPPAKQTPEPATQGPAADVITPGTPEEAVGEKKVVPEESLFRPGTIEAEWYNVVESTIIPEVRAVRWAAGGKFSAQKSELVDDRIACLISEYTALVNRNERSTSGKNNRQILDELMKQMMRDLLDIFGSSGFGFPVEVQQALRIAVHRELIQFAANYLTSEYQVAIQTPKLREATAEFVRDAGKTALPETSTAGEDAGVAETRNRQLLSAISEFSSSLDAQGGAIATLSDANPKKAQLLSDLGQLKEMLESFRIKVADGQPHEEDELTTLMGLAEQLVRASCQAEKELVLDAAEAPLTDVPEAPATDSTPTPLEVKIEIAPLAPEPARPAAVDLDRVRLAKDKEITGTLERTYPGYEAFLRSLTPEARSVIHNAHLKSIMVTKALLASLVKTETIARTFFDSIRSLGQFRTPFINALAEQLSHAEVYGILHEAIRIAALMEGGRKINAVRHAFQKEVEYYGYEYDSRNNMIFPTPKGRPRKSRPEADAYISGERLVMEIKSCGSGFDNGTAHFLLQIIREQGEFQLTPGASANSDVQAAIKFYNQMRKLGAAVQQRVIDKVEVHVTAKNGLDPEIAGFIQGTIPNVKIYVYAGPSTRFEDAKEITAREDILWVPTDRAGAKTRYALADPRTNPFLIEEAARGPALVVQNTAPAAPDAKPGEPVSEESALPAALLPADGAPEGKELKKVVLFDDARGTEALIEALEAIFGNEGRTVLTEDLPSTRSQNQLKDFLERFGARVDDIEKGLSGLVGIARFLRNIIKPLKDTPSKKIPETFEERFSYFEKLSRRLNQLRMLESLLKSWTAAEDAFKRLWSGCGQASELPEPVTSAVSDIVAILNAARSARGASDVARLFEQLMMSAKKLKEAVLAKATPEGTFEPRDLLTHLRETLAITSAETTKTMKGFVAEITTGNEIFGEIDSLERLGRQLTRMARDLSDEIGSPSLNTEAWFSQLQEVATIFEKARVLAGHLQNIERAAEATPGNDQITMARQELETELEQAVLGDDALATIERLISKAEDIIISQEELKESDAARRTILELYANIIIDDHTKPIRAFTGDVDIRELRERIPSGLVSASGDIPPATAELSTWIEGQFKAWNAERVAKVGQWTSISDADAKKFANSELRSVGSRADISQWDVPYHQDVRRFLVVDVLKKMQAGLKDDSRKASLTLREDMESFKTTVLGKNKDKPFQILKHGPKLITLVKRYMHLKGIK